MSDFLGIFLEWNERCEQMYLEVAAEASAMEHKCDYTFLLGPNDGEIRTMSEAMLEWAAEARKKADYIKALLANEPPENTTPDHFRSHK